MDTGIAARLWHEGEQMHTYRQTFHLFFKQASPFQLTIRRVSWRHVVALLFIIAVGGVVRFSSPHVIDWSKDHSDMAMIAQDIVAGKGLPLVGQPSSAGIPHSPFYVYILAIPYAVTNDPILVTMFIAAINLVGVGLLWLIAFRYIDPTAAFIAGLAYAVNPWVVSYSRSIWSGDHRAPLLLLGLLLGLYGFIEGKRWAQIVCLPIMLIALQIHYAAWALLPLYICLAWVGRDKTSWRILAVSALLGILVLLPFAIGIVQTLGDASTTVQVQRRVFSIRDLAKPYGQMAWLATGLGLEQYIARTNAADLISQAKLPTFLWIVQGAAVLVGFLSLWTRFPRSIAVLLSIWVCLPLLAFTLPIIGVAPHYFIPVIPGICLLVGIGFKRLLDWAGSRMPSARTGMWAVYSAIFLTQGLFSLTILKYVDTHFTPTQFGFGTPVHYLIGARGELQKHKDLVFIVSSDWLDFSRTGSWVWAPFLRDTATCLRDVQVGSGVAVFPAGPFTAVFAPRAPADPILNQLYQTSNPSVFSLRPSEGVYSVNSFVEAPAWPGSSITTIPPVRFENQVQLTGYRVESDRLLLAWLLPQSAKLDYQYTVGFVDAQGQLLTQHQAAFWPSKNWCQGDRLISWTAVGIPKDTKAVHIQMLLGGRETISRVIDSAGTINGAEAVISLAQ